MSDSRRMHDGDSDTSTLVRPPPFSQQRSTSTWLALALATTLAAAAGVGTLVRVPSITTGTVVVVAGHDQPRCALLLFPLRGSALVHDGTRVRMQVPGVPGRASAEVDRILGPLDAATLADRFALPDLVTQSLHGTYVAAVVEDLPSSPGQVAPVLGTAGTAVADTGRRPLGELFTGRGLEAGA